MDPILSQNLDVVHGTVDRFMTRDPIMSYAYSTYADFNRIYAPGIMQITGKSLKGQLVTGTVGNARFQSVHAEDSFTAKNITKEYSLDPYRHCTGGMVFNKAEISANSGPEQIFDVTKLQWRKAKAEVVDAMRAAMWSCLSSADDVSSPASIPYWLRLGTQSSTGGYTGYQSRYNDGSEPGTAFSTAGLTSTAAVNPEFANYYADHEGNLDESLFRLVNEAMMVQNFQGPTVLADAGGVPKVTYAAFTSKNVMLTLNQLMLKLNAQVGPNPISAGYFPTSGATLPGGIPLVWSDILDTENSSLYGTDPIFGVNLNVLYPVYLKDWNFAITWMDNPKKHMEHIGIIDWCGQMWCDAPHYAGYLISNHPSN